MSRTRMKSSESRLFDEATVKVDGRVMMDDLNESTGWNLPESDDYETIAGYVLYHTGVIPEDGPTIDDRRCGNRDSQGNESQNRIDARFTRSSQQDQKAG